MADIPKMTSELQPECGTLERKQLTFCVPRSDGTRTEGAVIQFFDGDNVTLRWQDKDGLTRSKVMNVVVFWFFNQDNMTYKTDFVELDGEFLCTHLFFVESCSTRITGVGSHWYAINPKNLKIRAVYITEVCKLIHEGKIPQSIFEPFLKKKIRYQDTFDHDEIEVSKTLEQHLEETTRV